MGLALLPAQVEAQERPGRMMLEAGFVGGTGDACLERYVGIKGRVTGPVSLYGMVAILRLGESSAARNRAAFPCTSTLMSDVHLWIGNGRVENRPQVSASGPKIGKPPARMASGSLPTRIQTGFRAPGAAPGLAHIPPLRALSGAQIVQSINRGESPPTRAAMGPSARGGQAGIPLVASPAHGEDRGNVSTPSPEGVGADIPGRHAKGRTPRQHGCILAGPIRLRPLQEEHVPFPGALEDYRSAMRDALKDVSGLAGHLNPRTLDARIVVWIARDFTEPHLSAIQGSTATLTRSSRSSPSG